MKGAAMHRAFLLFKKSGEAQPPPHSVSKKSGCPGLFRQRLKKCLRRGANSPPGKAGRYDFILEGCGPPNLPKWVFDSLRRGVTASPCASSGT